MSLKILNIFKRQKEIVVKDEPSIADFIRDKYKGIKFVSSDIFDGMTEAEIKDFKAECSTIFSKKCFSKVLDNLINEQVNFSIRQAQNMEQVNFGRATVNGIELVRDVFAEFDSETKKENSKPEEFNRFNVI